LGPLQKVGKRSIAIALGNVIKVITVGNEKYDAESSNDDVAFVGMPAATTRRKKTSISARKKSY